MHARDPFPIARSAMKAIALVPDSHVVDDIIMAITLLFTVNIVGFFQRF